MASHEYRIRGYVEEAHVDIVVAWIRVVSGSLPF